MLSGGTPSSKHPEYYGGPYPFVTTPCLGKNYIDSSDAVNWLSEIGVEKSSTHIIPAYSIMYGSRVGVGKSSINTCDMCTNQDILSFFNIDTSKYDLLFIKKVMDQYFDYVDAQKRGSTIKGVPSDVVKSIRIPVVAIEEQKSFAAFTEQSDKSKFTGFKSQFIEMFYGKGYPVKKIGDVIEKTISRVAKVFEKTDEIQYLDISSIDNSSKTVTGLTPYVLKDAPSRAQYVLKQGDIMYSTVRPNLQNIAINPYSDDNVVGSTGFCVLRCTGVTTGYMWGVINSVPFTEAMTNQASGANYPAVTDKVVHAYEIPVPPVEEQTAYEQLVKQSDKSK